MYRKMPGSQMLRHKCNFTNQIGFSSRGYSRTIPKGGVQPTKAAPRQDCKAAASHGVVEVCEHKKEMLNFVAIYFFFIILTQLVT